MPFEKTGKRLHKIDILRNGKVRLSFSDKNIVLSKDAFTNFFLYEGKEVTAKELSEMEKEGALDELLRYGKRIASKGAYSSYEIKEKLYQKNPKTAAKVFQNLIDSGFIDDKMLAQDIFEVRLSEGYGEERIKRELLSKKHIDPEIIASLDSSNLSKKEAKDLLPLYEKKYSSSSNQERREKIKMALLRRGFSEKEINESLSLISSLPASKEVFNATKEARSFYRHYGRKYNGKELDNRVVMALLRKGYTRKTIAKAMEDMKDGSC